MDLATRNWDKLVPSTANFLDREFRAAMRPREPKTAGANGDGECSLSTGRHAQASVLGLSDRDDAKMPAGRWSSIAEMTPGKRP